MPSFPVATQTPIAKMHAGAADPSLHLTSPSRHRLTSLPWANAADAEHLLRLSDGPIIQKNGYVANICRAHGRQSYGCPACLEDRRDPFYFGTNVGTPVRGGAAKSKHPHISSDLSLGNASKPPSEGSPKLRRQNFTRLMWE